MYDVLQKVYTLQSIPFNGIFSLLRCVLLCSLLFHVDDDDDDVYCTQTVYKLCDPMNEHETK